MNKILSALSGLSIGKVFNALAPVLALIRQLFGWLMDQVTVPVICLIAFSYFTIENFQKPTYSTDRNRLADSLAISARAIQVLMLDTADLRKRERDYKRKYDSTNQAYTDYRNWVLSLNPSELQREVNRVFNQK